MKTTIRTDKDRKDHIKLMRDWSLDEPWRVEWSKERKKRSLDQNALMWKWMEILGNHFGYTKDDMSLEIKRVCDAPKRHWKSLEGHDRWEYSTSDADTAAMSAYMTRIQAWAASEGIGLPTPEQAARYW